MTAVQTVPDVPTVSRRTRMQPPLIVAAAALGGCVLVSLVDPNEPGHYPICPTKALTGFDCPFCGGMRCARSLVRGDLAGAIDHNALIVVLAPLAVVAWALWIWRAWSGREPIQTPARARTKRILLTALIVVMVGFTIYRNLPVGSYFGSGLA